MVFFEILFKYLCLISFDILFGFLAFLLWKYVNDTYFSHLELTLLREENKYLKEQNLKVNGTSTDFWSDNYD